MGEPHEVKRLKTGVSAAFWCKPKAEGPFYEFKPATWPHPALRDSSEQISWLDRLFEGAIEVTDQGTRALTMLLTGPPGTGKSILALEMCYRLSLYHKYPNRKGGLFCLYVSTENSAKRIITKVKSFGWKQAKYLFQEYDFSSGFPHVAVLGADKIRNYIENKQSPDLSRIVERLAGEWAQFLDKEKSYQKLGLSSPDVLVIDSLNVISASNKAEIFNQFLNVATQGPALVIFVMESGSSGQMHDYWGYICDIILRLDRKYTEEYMLRTLEVVKARNQQHVWGQHQLKIYPGPQVPSTSASSKKMKPYDQLVQARRRTPYREEGGIFIFPSIHYYLSTYKQEVLSREPTKIKFPLEELNGTLEGGLPAGRCTALIGARGAHKSHVGYFHLLSRILENEKAIVVSLRDDEGMARKTMSKILHQQFVSHPDWKDKFKNPPPKKRKTGNFSYELEVLEDFEREDNLEIIFYPPGYISPDEFFHRIFITIQRMKAGESKPLTVLFNSLDQLPARFPLCARESIFVPGLIQMFTAEKATCIFVAVNEPGQPEEQYGLLQMADMILSMRPRRFKKKYYDWLFKNKKSKRAIEQSETTSRSDPMIQAVVLHTVRIPGGETAGARGLLLLANDRSIKPPPGLHFIPFPEEFPVGDKVEI